MLIGSFAIGYVPVQIPGSLLAQRIGEKRMISANLLVQTVGCFLLPPLAKLGALPLSVCLAVMGTFQGCRVFANNAISARWMPDGLERIWVQQAQQWVGQAAISLNIWFVPKLATARGWKAVPRFYGVLSAVMLVLWQLWAADRPSQWRGPVALLPDEAALLAAIGKEEQPTPPTPPPTRVRVLGD